MLTSTDNGIMPSMDCCGGGSLFWIIILFLFFFMNGGLGNSGALTRAEMHDGFNVNQLENGQRAIEKSICDLGSATQQGFANSQYRMMDGFANVGRDLCNGFNGVQSALAENRFASQQCCCETNRNIDAVRYENSKNTCDITNAIHAEGEATRALINQNTMQELRDQLQAAQLQLGTLSQTQNLINTLRPCPTPAYITCSPYQTYNNWGCGCGCNCN